MKSKRDWLAEFCRKENDAHDMLIEAGFSPQGIGINERGVLARVVTKQEGDKYSVWYFDTWQEAVEELLGKD